MKNSIRATWLLCAMVIVAGIYFRIMPLEAEITDTNARSEVILQQASTDERALQDEPRMRLTAQHIRNDLAGLRIRSSDNTCQALLGDLQATALRNNLTVTAVKPLSDPQHARELEISAHGSYRDIVHFLRDLSHMPTLARVLSVQLDRNTNDLHPLSTLDAVTRIQTILFPPAQAGETISTTDSDRPRIEEIPEISLQRDPFVSEESITMLPQSTSAMNTVASLLPSSIGKRRQDGILGIVVGTQPHLLANVNGNTKILSIGDTFSGHTILGITVHGITLDDHSNLHIPLLDQ
jgi:Tfp pilus assembly protein PilO